MKVVNKDESKQISDEEVIRNFISDENHKEKALALADQIKKDFKNWFTLNSFVKKYNNDKNEAGVKLRMLALFGFVVSRENKLKQVEFKITLTKEDRIFILRDKLQSIEIERLMIENEIEILSK